MIRNQEFKIYLIVMLVIILVGFVGIQYKPHFGVFIYLVVGILLLLCNVIFTFYRYQKIKEMTEHINRIRNGNFILDLRDHQEGELSILRSELYKVTLMLTEQAQLLQTDKTYLSEALSDISHQLKTPLTSMMVMTDLLSQEQLPIEKRQDFTKKIQSQLLRIEWLVSTLLKMSKLDAKAIVLKREHIVVKDMIKKATIPLLIPIEIKDQQLIIEGEDDASFCGDEAWFVEAVTNIIKNAIEHTPHRGSIQICYAENSLYTKIIIEDTGEGIKQKDLPYIFQRFYKGENSSPDSVGIGLAFAKQVIMLQGGVIHVNEGEDEGTRFVIKIYK